MTPIKENARLSTDLDCQHHTVKGIRNFDPPPPAYVSTDDPRLSDKRLIQNGTVTNASVASWAAIDQSKLNFAGSSPPTPWLGNASNQFARGDLVQQKSQKGVAGGYVALDASGKLPSGNVTAGGGGGKVSSVGLAMPEEFTVSGSPVISGAGTLTAAWANTPDGSYFGANGPKKLSSTTGPLRPYFVAKPLPMALMPNLDASKFSTGVFGLPMLPVMVGVGTNHAPGLLPDPGLNGDPNDYIGRDGKWRQFVVGASYQPTLPNVSITLNPTAAFGHGLILKTIKDAYLFYRVNGAGAFIEADGNQVNLTVDDNDFVEAYAAKAGYNNSAVSAYLVAIPAPIVEIGTL